MKAKLLRSAVIVAVITTLFAILVDDSWYGDLHFKSRRVASFGASLRWLFVDRVGYWPGVALFAFSVSLVQGFFYVGGAKTRQTIVSRPAPDAFGTAPAAPKPAIKGTFGRRTGIPARAPAASGNLVSLALRVIRENSVNWYLCHLGDEREPANLVAQLKQAGDSELAELIEEISTTYARFEAIRTSREEGELTRVETEEYEAATRPLELQVFGILRARM